VLGVNESAIYLSRQTGWTLDEVGSLSPEQFRKVLEEVRFQEREDDYREAYNFASVMATIANVNRGKNGRHWKASDFVGQPPERKSKEKPKDEIQDIVDRCQERGIEPPKFVLQPIGG